MSGIAGIIRLGRSSRLRRHDRATSDRDGASRSRWQRHLARWPPRRSGMRLCTPPPNRGRRTQPFVDGTLAIVADVRLDNRTELLALLDRRGQAIGDAALVLAAFRRWGEACLSRLEGDFAFAIWNEREQTLFCARDPFGVKPFVYALLPGKLLAFASEVRALLAFDEIPRDLDEKRIADFLAVYFDEPERTFYRVLRRLEGGCSLTLGDGRTPTRIATGRQSASPPSTSAAPIAMPNTRKDFASTSSAPCASGCAQSNRPTSARCSAVASIRRRLPASHATSCARRTRPPLPVFSWIFSDSMDADEREYQDVGHRRGWDATGHARLGPALMSRRGPESTRSSRTGRFTHRTTI